MGIFLESFIYFKKKNSSNFDSQHVLTNYKKQTICTKNKDTIKHLI